MNIKHTSREVIDRKLLAALTDENVVAILATKQDLDDLHAALCGYKLSTRNGNVISWAAYEERRKNLAEGIKQLRDQAFIERQ